MTTGPLVSVGIPTYNRPDGLLRTIKQIASQTYAHLEIVVSNNASPNPLVAQLLARCAELDPRIRVVNQPENLGLLKNFQYVLNHSAGEYFMWAADDDEWDPNFVAVCVNGLQRHDVGLVMPGFLRHNRALGVRGTAALPKMTGQNRFAEAMAFYDATPHSIMYGLHRRNAIAWYATAELDAADDEFMVVRQILEQGVLTLPEQVLYVAGIEDATYQIKFAKEADDRYFFQGRRLMHFGRLILECKSLTDLQKVALIKRVLLCKMSFVLNFEAELRHPEQLALTRLLYVFLSNLDVRHLGLYAQLMAQTNASLAAQAGQATPAAPQPQAVAA